MDKLIVAECSYHGANRILYLFRGLTKREVITIIADDNLAGEACEGIIFHSIAKSTGNHHIDTIVLDTEATQ